LIKTDGGLKMEVAEAVQGVMGMKPHSIGNMDNIVRAISVGVLESGNPGSIATEFDYGIYKIVARYENVSEPPRVDISTERRVFWNNELLEKIKVLLVGLIEENKSFVSKTGDGSGENPIIILKWERENRTVRAFR